MNEVFNVAWSNAGNRQSEMSKRIFFPECKEGELQEQRGCQSGLMNFPLEMGITHPPPSQFQKSEFFHCEE